MKIGIVCYPTFGGSGVVATELGKSLANEGHRIHFIAYQQPQRLEHFHELISYHEVRVPSYPLFEYPPFGVALAGKMVDVVRHEQLDILHVHYAIPHASAAFIAKQILAQEQISIPTITTLHGTDITLVGRDETYGPVVEFSINQSEGVTAVSENLKKETLEIFNIDRDIQVIPNFIDLSRFTRKNKDHFRKAIATHDEKVLIHTSNFRKVKRVDDVVRVFQKISQEIPSKLLFVGDGPERSHVEQLSRELGVCDDIKFLGKQEPVEELLAISDLFFMPSESESFGLAALEAMACKVPVISSNTGGIPELNIQGKTGFMSDIGAIDDMAANGIKLLKDDELLNEFRENAYQQASKFKLSNIVPLYINVYEDVLKGSGGLK